MVIKLLALIDNVLYFNSFVLPSKQLEVDRADRVTLFPHFMERKGNNERKGKDSYHSISIWGILYDAADKAIKQHSEKVQAIRKFYSWCCCLLSFDNFIFIYWGMDCEGRNIILTKKV